MKPIKINNLNEIELGWRKKLIVVTDKGINVDKGYTSTKAIERDYKNRNIVSVREVDHRFRTFREFELCN
jgi:hypothetical protein